MRTLTLAGIVALILAAPGAAQQLPFRSYTARDGLVSSTVRTLYQDDGGYLWLGTTHGLVRYDGTAFTPFTTAQGLAFDWVNDVAEDRDGALWIATNRDGLSRYDGMQFTTHRVAPAHPDSSANRINRLLLLRDGMFLVGTDAGVFYRDGAGWRPLVSPQPLLREPVTALLEDRHGTLWVGTPEGLCFRRRGASEFTALDGFAGMTALVEGVDGALWAGTESGLQRVRPASPASLASEALPEPLPPAMQTLALQWIRALRIDADSALWIGTNGAGLFRWSREGDLERYTTANGLAGNNVLAILQDREHSLWFATTSGVSKLSRQHVLSYTVADGLADHEIRALAQDGAGRLWFGTKQGLSKLEEGAITTYTTADGLAHDYILALLTDRDGSVWVGTEDGVSRIRKTRTGDAVVTYGPSAGWVPEHGGRTNRARALYQDEAGQVWVGTDAGVSVFVRGRFVALSLPHPETVVTALVRDAEGDLWVGFNVGGIVRYAVEEGPEGPLALREVARYRKQDGLPDDNIRCSMRDRAGPIWFGTRFGGVIRFDVAQGRVTGLQAYTTGDGLAGDFVRGIMRDREANLWFATDRGASMLPVHRESRAPFRRLSLGDGLAGEEVNAVFEGRDGHLWFATSNGATRYRPPASPNMTPPFVYLTQVAVLGVADSSALRARHADLAPHQRSVAFEYVGVSFKDEADVRYQYMLDGFDRDWSPVTARRYVNYTMLSPGTYLFKVRARSADGVWSAEPATFAFRIATPFWRAWWFIGLAVALLTALLGSLHRYRMRRMLELERLRREIATDLHDDIGSTLSSISIYSELARRETAAVAPAADPLLRHIGDNARAMLDAMDDIVWAINPEHDALGHITHRMQAFAAELFEAHGIAYTITIPDDARHVTLPMEARRQFYLLFKEAVNNLVRHAHCRRAAVSLALRGARLVLTVRDDGVGFHANGHGDGPPPGDGLANMQRRAEAVGGTLSIQTAPGRGTVVVFTMRIP